MVSLYFINTITDHKISGKNTIKKNKMVTINSVHTYFKGIIAILNNVKPIKNSLSTNCETKNK